MDERVGGGGVDDHVRLLPGERLEHRAVRTDAEPRPHELVAGVVPPERRREPARLEARQRIAQPLQRAQRRLREELAADERRHRVARQPEHERLAAHAERHRLARLDRNAPEHLLDTELRLDPAHEIVRPDRDAARRDEDVRREPALERRPVRRLVVGDDRQHIDVGARGGERGREHESVRLVDLSGSKRLAGPCELRAGGEHRDARPPHARHGGEARGRKRAELRRAEPDARLHDHVARTRVAAARANVLARQGEGSRPPRSCCHVGQHTRWG